MLKKKAIILGAGPTGLITAWKLLEADWDVTIIEKKGSSGGLCRHRTSYISYTRKIIKKFLEKTLR